MIYVNWSPGVDYIFYVDLMVICCVCHAENIEIGSMMVLVFSCSLYLTFLFTEFPNFFLLNGLFVEYSRHSLLFSCIGKIGATVVWCNA